MELFEGLNISDNKKLCQKWMNQFPTLFFSFKDVDGLTFSSAYDMLTMKLADLFRQHQYLLESNAVDDGDKAAFTWIKNNHASPAEIKNAFILILRIMQEYYGKPAIFLLDEYDVPVAKAEENGYYAEMMEVMRAMLGTTWQLMTVWALPLQTISVIIDVDRFLHLNIRLEANTIKHYNRKLKKFRLETESYR